MLWLPLSVAACALSTIATAASATRFWLNWDLRVSSVRWLLFMVFACLAFWAFFRCILYIHLCVVLTNPHGIEPKPRGPRWTVSKLDGLGVQALPHLYTRRTWWVVIVACFGDIALLGVIVWLLPLTYELSKLALQSMDRGAEREHAKLRLYLGIGHTVIAIFFVAEVTLVTVSRGYTTATHVLLLLIYIIGVVTIVYIIGSLLFVKYRGRHLESIHGEFTPSPVYVRLRQIMVAYVVMVLPYQASSSICNAESYTGRPVQTFLGASLVFYSFVGLTSSIVAGCSQPCVLRACRPCVPDGFEAELFRRHNRVSSPQHHAIGAAQARLTEPPVFVNTDIESSSALWAIADGAIMQRSVDLHDKILRAALATHGGYEVTTRGDSFLLVFSSIQQAIAFCLDAQLRLLAAPWPRQLARLSPASGRLRVGHRLVFNGLRIRMGIHDAHETEGRLVVDTHAITGRMTYTGASEVIAADVGELGHGGQIVATHRVAAWLSANANQIGIRFSIKFLGHLSIRLTCDDTTRVGVYDILPTSLVGRRTVWSAHRQSPASPQNRLIQSPF